VLFEGSEEAPGAKGLGWFSGTVRKLQAADGLKIPHMGWNQVELASGGHPALSAAGGDQTWFYFVHSYFAVPIVLLFNMYLVGDTAPSAIAFFIIVGILFLPCISLAFNSFGLDRPLGLDRYTLLPLSDKQKLFSKNLAFGTIIMVLFVTILPLTFWKLGMRTSVLGLIELIVVWLAYVSYGNWISVRQPFKMQFYRFASGGSPVDAVMGVIFGSVPAAVTVYLASNEDNGALWKLVLMTVIYLAIFLFSLSRSARLLESQRENIRRALS
jgi:hypothetical protein